MASLQTENIINKGIIGEGAFGVVYLVEKDGEQFAIKIMDWSSRDQREVAINEIKILKELSHENVMVYVESFEQNGLLYVVSEYCAGGDLSRFLDNAQRPVPEDLLLVWLWQIACGLEYMHMKDPPVLHRDLKPSNIYLTAEGTLRLGDMGIARVMESPAAMAQTFCGTPPYMSPEALRAQRYNSMTDIWGLGCCVVEMATLKRAYEGSSIYILRSVVTKQREPLPDSCSRDLDDLLSRMMCLDYKQRLSATEILDSNLLQGCGKRPKAPLDLLKKHDMMRFLCLDKTSKEPSSGTTVHSLHESMSNLRDILNHEDTITSYHYRIEHRVHHRGSERTLVNRVAIQTVMHNPSQKTVSKTTKREPNVPRRNSSVTDESMWRAISTSVRKTLDDTMATVKPAQTPAVSLVGEPSPSEATDSTVSTLSSMFSSTLSVDSDALSTASSLVLSTNVDPADLQMVDLQRRKQLYSETLQAQLQTLLNIPESQVSVLTQIFILLTLKQSMSHST